MTQSSNFRITPALADHATQIVELFHTCLGEAGGVPSIDFWNWKHHQNPAGSSPILLAWEGDQLVGLRAFMRFEFCSSGKRLIGFRAVDTATHPDFRGQGIFRKLTLALVDQVRELRADAPAFIFNTPNKLSLPGYLKMGWKVWGKPRVAVWPRRVLFGAKRFDRASRELKSFRTDHVANLASTKTHILKDAQYLDWRYVSIPMAGYGLCVFDEKGHTYHVFIHQKRRRGIYEARVCDILKDGIPQNSLDDSEWRAIWRHLPGHVVTFAADTSRRQWLEFANLSPVVTSRSLNDQWPVAPFDTFSFTLGDLELF